MRTLDVSSALLSYLTAGPPVGTSTDTRRVGRSHWAAWVDRAVRSRRVGCAGPCRCGLESEGRDRDRPRAVGAGVPAAFGEAWRGRPRPQARPLLPPRWSPPHRELHRTGPTGRSPIDTTADRVLAVAVPPAAIGLVSGRLLADAPATGGRPLVYRDASRRTCRDGFGKHPECGSSGCCLKGLSTGLDTAECDVVALAR